MTATRDHAFLLEKLRPEDAQSSQGAAGAVSSVLACVRSPRGQGLRLFSGLGSQHRPVRVKTSPRQGYCFLLWFTGL